MFMVGGWREVFDKALAVAGHLTVFIGPDRVGELPSDARVDLVAGDIESVPDCLSAA